MKKLWTLFSFLVFGFSLNAQNVFWQETASSPTLLADYGNTCVAINPNNTLFVGTFVSGIFRSVDDGATWENVVYIRDSTVNKIICRGAEEVFAIVGNKVYYSANSGDTWVQNKVPTTYPLTDIELLGTQKIVVSTADVVTTSPGNSDYYGDGVFVSEDNGITWTNRSAGLQHFKAITNLAVGNNNIMVASMASYTGFKGGLYFSMNEGLEWIQMPMFRYYGKRFHELLSPAQIYEVYCLEFDKADNLYMSYHGSGGNFGMEGGLYNNIYRALADSLWTPLPVNNLGFDFDFRGFSSLYFANNQTHVYSSLETQGSVSHGGAFRKNRNDEFFKRKVFGIYPVRESLLKVQYAENSEGRIFAVQTFDHRVYFTDSSAFSTGIEHVRKMELDVYPNPSQHYVSIGGLDQNERIEHVWLYDIRGQLMQEQAFLDNNQFIFDINKEYNGLYILKIQTDKSFYSQKIKIEKD